MDSLDILNNLDLKDQLDDVDIDHIIEKYSTNESTLDNNSFEDCEPPIECDDFYLVDKLIKSRADYSRQNSLILNNTANSSCLTDADLTKIYSELNDIHQRLFVSEIILNFLAQ